MIEFKRYLIAGGLIILACAGLAYVGFSLSTQAHLPTDGVLLSELMPSGVSVATIVSSEAQNLQVGDELLSIDGYSIWELVDRSLAGSSSPVTNWEVGETVIYRLVREERVLEVPVTLMALPLGRLALIRSGVYALLLVSLVVTGYILLARPGDPAARLLVSVAIAMLCPLGLHLQTAIFVSPALFLVENVLKFLSQCLLFSLLLHLFLVFPIVKPVLRGREGWLTALHVGNLLLCAVLGLASGNTPAERLAGIWQVASWTGLVMMVASVVSVVHTYLTAREATARIQLRWIAWGAVVGLLPFILLTGLPESISGRGILMIEVTSFFIILLPISIAIAVARYRLLQIDVLIHRSLLYGFLTLALTGVYLLIVAALEALLVGLTGRANEPLVVFISTLAVSTAFWSLRSRAGRLVDQLFYRTQIEPRVLLAETSEQLARMGDLDEMVSLFTRVIPGRLGARTGTLMVLGEDLAELEPAGSSNLSPPSMEIPHVWARHGGEPVLRSLPPKWFPAEGIDWMERSGMELLFLLTVGEQMVGVWGVGPRQSGSAYASEQIRALAVIARQAAGAVQNARLVHRLKVHGQELEEEVLGRTRDLESERNRLNGILQNMADGLMVTDLEGRILLVNPAFEEMVRIPARMLLGQVLGEVLALPALDALIGRAGEEKMASARTTDVTLGDHVLRASVSVLGDRSGIIAVLRDVTHEVEVDRMKTEFISTVSHELRTPLTSVLGFAKLIRRNFDRSIVPALPQQPDVQKAVRRVDENLSIIVSEGARLTRLINDVLDIAKMEAGKIQWNDQPIAVEELVHETVQSVSALAAEKGLPVIIDVAHDLPRLVADPDRIRQVLTNLLSNSIKFTDEGAISVTVQLLSPGTRIHDWRAANPTAPALLVSVLDSGAGIASHDLPRLFLRFQQLGGDMLTDKPKGTGLGLSICREIVLHYGGAIWAESTVGEGTQFFFVLPLPRQGATSVDAVFAPSLQVASRADDGSGLILIADDEPHIRELLRLMLEEEGHRVLAVATGAEAVDQARRLRPKLIILDVMMPGISGFDALQILKSDPATRRIPVIVLSVVEKQQDPELQADAHLVKPVESAELSSTVSWLLARERSADSLSPRGSSSGG